MGTRVSGSSFGDGGSTPTGINKLIDDFSKLMSESELSDILFIIGQEEYRINSHKLILKSR